MEAYQIERYIRAYLEQHCNTGVDWQTADGDMMLTHPKMGLQARDLIMLIYSLEEEYGIRFDAAEFLDYGLATINRIVAAVSKLA